MDNDLDTLLRAGDIEGAARAAQAKGLHRKAAELYSLLGRHAEAAIVALEANDWRAALDAGLASGDERVIAAVCDEIGKHGALAEAAAAHARITQRGDVAARILEPLFPAEAGQAWYERGEYGLAAKCFDRANQAGKTIMALEQHLSQFGDDVESAERLAVLRATRGDDEGALRALQLAAKHSPPVQVLERLVEALRRVGLEGSARVALRRVKSLNASASLDLDDYHDRLPRGSGEQRYAGRYRVLRQVGSGASGRVLEAVDELTGESVALKVLTVGDDKGAAFGRFMREAELAKVLDDPTLVTMRALDPEGPTIVYDWMPGGTLSERIGKLTLVEVRAISLRILRAISVLHRHGVVHRDLKPSNVLFDPAGQARLGDLGAAHLNDLGATVTGGLVGSLPYMSPEQITGAPVSAGTDLYAFGCMLFQMLTGVTPFLGPDFVMQHLNDPIPKPSTVRPALGTSFDQLLGELLAKDPEKRIPDAGECERRLTALPWTELRHESASVPPVRRTSIAPPSAKLAIEWLVPASSDEHPERWYDQRLERLVDRVRVDPTKRDTLYRWAAASASDLQCIVDIEDDGDSELFAYALALTEGEVLAADALHGLERNRILAALNVIGIDGLRAGVALVGRCKLHGVVALVRTLSEP